jgi:hypothetical protein
MRRLSLWTLLLVAACAGSPTPDGALAPEPAAVTRISLSIAGPGAIAVPALHSSCHGTCSFVATPGTSVHLEVADELQARFAGWSGACVGNGACDLIAGQDTAIGAAFYP